MVRQHLFHNLSSASPYRFRVRQYDNDTHAIKTEWSVPKVLTTHHSKHWRQHEWVNLRLKGTGRNNHNSSVFMVDDTVLLNHAFFKGLYLAVLDRRDLSLAYSGFFNTSTLPTVPNNLTGEPQIKQLHGEFEFIDDFGIAHQMARRIKMYDHNFFIVVISQYSWE
jgi:hypothetical protein